jgi:hypothetical protein
LYSWGEFIAKPQPFGLLPKLAVRLDRIRLQPYDLSHEPAGWLTLGAKIMLGPALAALFGGDTHNSELFIVIFTIVGLKTSFILIEMYITSKTAPS